jgi:hypothetical protein
VQSGSTDRSFAFRPHVGAIDADLTDMGRDVAPVIAARVLLARGVGDDRVFAHLAKTWRLNDVDLRAAVAAAHVLLRRAGPTDPAPSDG